MKMMHVYLMHSPDKALDAIKTIDQESTDLVIGLGLVLLVDDNGGWQWYAFANLQDPKASEDERVLSALKKGGVRSDFSTLLEALSRLSQQVIGGNAVVDRESHQSGAKPEGHLFIFVRGRRQCHKFPGWHLTLRPSQGFISRRPTQRWWCSGNWLFS
jgi:hypothetical protein